MPNKKVSLILIDQKSITIGVSILAVVIPFFLGQPQLLVGSIVNLAILLSVIYLPINLAYPVLILPSLAVLMRGLVFGPFTKFLVLFLPIIWLGNYLLYKSFKSFYTEKKQPYFLSLILSGLIKSLVIFSITLILYNLKIVPALFLTSMGMFQLITVLTGGLIFLLIKRSLLER